MMDSSKDERNGERSHLLVRKPGLDSNSQKEEEEKKFDPSSSLGRSERHDVNPMIAGEATSAPYHSSSFIVGIESEKERRETFDDHIVGNDNDNNNENSSNHSNFSLASFLSGSGSFTTRLRRWSRRKRCKGLLTTCVAFGVFILVILGVLSLIRYLLHAAGWTHQHYQHQHQTDQSSSSSSQNPVNSNGSGATEPNRGIFNHHWGDNSNNNNNGNQKNTVTSSITEEQYDYIVVGGGPSGIITAVHLARRLRNEFHQQHVVTRGNTARGLGKVLLLESGTAAQSGVLLNLPKLASGHGAQQMNNARAPVTNDGQEGQHQTVTRSTTTTATAFGSYFGDISNDNIRHEVQQQQQQQLQQQHLNEFDVPLLWSGVASSRGVGGIGGRGDVNGFGKQYCLHHWPVEKTLLARALGGGGVHNAMIYVRSLPTDYERWNLTGWTWEDILPHYRALESYNDTMYEIPSFWMEEEEEEEESLPSTARQEENDDHSQDERSDASHPWRGFNGLIRTAPAGPAIDTVAPLFVRSCLNADIPLASRGFNEPDPERRVGAGYYEFNIRDGVRDSVASALLGKNYNGDHVNDYAPPDNLVVHTGATVLRVINEKNVRTGKPRAIGVEFRSNNNGAIRTVLLKKTPGHRPSEVVLAAGAILTPQILTNSGIGDGGSVADVPGVGKNLQDHPVVPMAFSLNSELIQQASSVYTVAEEMEDYFMSVWRLRSIKAQTGPGISPGQARDVFDDIGTFGTAGFSAGAFLRSPWAGSDPDLQLTVFPRILEPHIIQQTKSSQRSRDDRNHRNFAMLVTVALLRPEARYEVRVSRKRVQSEYQLTEGGSGVELYNFSLPSIELPEGQSTYLADLDVKRLAWGIAEVRRIRSFPPLSENTGEEVYPGSGIIDADLENFIRNNHLPNSHWVGSTKMGSDDDPDAVVDEKLKVRGVEDLRIVDAGVIPLIPNGNTHSTVCVVAMRAVDLILG